MTDIEYWLVPEDGDVVTGWTVAPRPEDVVTGEDLKRGNVMAKHKHTVEMVGPAEFRKGAVAYDPSIQADKPYKVGWLRARLANGNDVFVGIAKEHPSGGPAIVHEFHAQQEDGSRTRLAFSLSPEACSALMALYLAHGLITHLPTIEDIKLTPVPEEKG